MSGGATLLNNAFVGVNMGCSYTLLPFGKKVLFDFWYYMSSFINLFVITDLPMLHTRYPFVGVISGSVALGPHEQWIRDCKSAFDKDCSIDSRV
jgi:hypothetical protein